MSNGSVLLPTLSVLASLPWPHPSCISAHILISAIHLASFIPAPCIALMLLKQINTWQSIPSTSVVVPRYTTGVSMIKFYHHHLHNPEWKHVMHRSKNTSLLYLSRFFRYLYFTWVFIFLTTFYFYSLHLKAFLLYFLQLPREWKPTAERSAVSYRSC